MIAERRSVWFELGVPCDGEYVRDTQATDHGPLPGHCPRGVRMDLMPFSSVAAGLLAHLVGALSQTFDAPIWDEHRKMKWICDSA